MPSPPPTSAAPLPPLSHLPPSPTPSASPLPQGPQPAPAAKAAAGKAPPSAWPLAPPPEGRQPLRRSDFLRFLWCAPFFWMIAFLALEAALAAGTTALIIKAGKDLADESFLISDLAWIVALQSLSFAVGAVSWVFAERAGFGAFGRYLLRFARDNRAHASLLADKAAREQAEPFLTNETFHILFELIYELEADLKLLLGLVFNAVVLGMAIDAGLPAVYGAVFVLLLALQWALRRPVAGAYLAQQRATNRMTAHTYTAWDNITSGNRYNFRLWHAGFKTRLRGALGATIRAIVAREGMAALGGIIGLLIVFAYLAVVAAKGAGDTGLLIALAATLPRQIEMASDVHHLASGWNDLLAVWTRIGGACQAMRPEPDAGFERRIDFAGLALSVTQGPGSSGEKQPCCTENLDSLLQKIEQMRTGRIEVRGRNGAGKSTLLAALKTRLGAQAFYWPTTDRLSFAFAQAAAQADEDAEDVEDGDGRKGEDQSFGAATQDSRSAQGAENNPSRSAPSGFSSGERQLKSLQEIAAQTRARVYLLDEWDANLDPRNRAQAEALVQQLAARAVVVEISHRDRG